MEPSFAVLICCPADAGDSALQTISDLLSGEISTDEIHVAAASAPAQLVSELRALLEHGKISTLALHEGEVSRPALQRALVEQSQRKYGLFLDAGTRLETSWRGALRDFLNIADPFDAAAIIEHTPRTRRYNAALRRRPWFKQSVGTPHDEQPPDSRAAECLSGTYGSQILRLDFARRHSYPDSETGESFPEIYLGDLVAQQGGNLIQFSPPLAAAIRNPPRPAITAVARAAPVTALPNASPEMLYDRRDLSCLLREAERAQHSGNMDDAIRRFRDILRVDPTERGTLYRLAGLLKGRGERNEAEELLKRSVAAGEDFIEPRIELADLLVELEKLEEAEFHYRRTLELRPSLVRVRYNLGFVQLKLGRSQESIATFESVIREAPELHEARRALCHAYVQAGDFENALRNVEILIGQQSQAYQLPQLHQLREELKKVINNGRR